MKTEEKSRKDNILGWDNKDKLKKKDKNRMIRGRVGGKEIDD